MSGFCKALLWFPNVSVSTKSCCRSFLLIFTNGHLLLSQRKASIWFHRLWSPKTCWRTEGGLNSFPLPSGESFCAFDAFPRSRSKLCAAPLSVNSKLNSRGVEVAQGVLMTALILLKWLLGQSNDGCGVMVRLSLLGGFVEIQGKFWHSASSCANCCAANAKVALRHAFSFHSWDSLWGMRSCADWCADDAKLSLRCAFYFCAWGSCWGMSSCANCCADDATLSSQHAFSFGAWGSCWGTFIINGFGMLGVVGMFSIRGGSSTWNLLLFAASVD